jgi:hypothetical protein
MADKSPLSVLTAPDVRFATWVANYLTELGIRADVKPDIPPPNLDPLSGIMTMADPAGFEVVVADPACANEARRLLAERIDEWKALYAKRAARAAREGTMSVECEECGESSDWPASAMGSTENCPSCSAYMDIPDPEDDWADFDAGADEDEAK